MGHVLRRRLQQARFASVGQEAIINVMIAANYLRGRLELACSRQGLTGPQYNVLRILAAVYPTGHPRFEIQSRMIERSPDVTRLIDTLIANRLVERFQSDGDRRQSMARITKKGLSLVHQVAPHVKKFNEDSSNVFTAKEAKELSRLCQKIYVSDLE